MEEKRQGASYKSAYEGIRVIDFTHILAGPYCSKTMADLGAEVIKVEPPVTGERGRLLPLIKNGASGFYMWRNAGKKGLCLDMKQPEAVEIFRELARVSDVVVQNRLVGTVDRLGVGYEDIRKVNPKIIYVSISGYGQNGPLAHWPGGDSTIEALSGAMAIGGHTDGPPLASWVPWVDFCTGTHAVAAVGAALFHRERTGVGQHIDVSMLDCAFAYHDFPIEEYLMSDGQVERGRTGPMHPTLALLATVKCKDGYLLLSGSSDDAWRKLTELMGCPELASDPRFDIGVHRNDNKEECYRLVSEWIKDYGVDEAIMILTEVGVRGTPILSIGEITNHPQIAAREMLVEMDHPQVGKFKLVNTPFKMSETEARVRDRAPLLGEHNEELLTRLLGYSKDRIDELWKKKVLYAEEAVFKLTGS